MSGPSHRSAVIKKSAARRTNVPVRLGENAEPAPHKPVATTADGRPIVHVRKNGDLVEALEVTCPCGKHMVIECLYDGQQTETSP